MRSSIATPEDRRRRTAEIVTRRGRQHACALDFLVYGDNPPAGRPGGDRHADRCICDPVCSRNYDLWPDDDAGPFPDSMYEGSGIGALYGVGVPSLEELLKRGWGEAEANEQRNAAFDRLFYPFAAQLAGWNVRP